MEAINDPWHFCLLISTRFTQTWIYSTYPDMFANSPLMIHSSLALLGTWWSTYLAQLFCQVLRGMPHPWARCHLLQHKSLISPKQFL